MNPSLGVRSSGTPSPTQKSQSDVTEVTTAAPAFLTRHLDFCECQETSHSPGEGVLASTLSDFLEVMVLLCFCLTAVWSMAGSLGESIFSKEHLATGGVSVRESSSPESYQKWKGSKCQLTEAGERGAWENLASEHLAQGIWTERAAPTWSII